MKAVAVKTPISCSASDLYIDENVSIPSFSEDDHIEVLIKVHYTALNRADIVQRNGKYPPPKGSSNILGLEVSGIIEKFCTGKESEGNFKVGDKVMALVEGGGYAEYVVAPITQVMHAPLDLDKSAAIPEAFLTAYQCFFKIGQLHKRDNLDKRGLNVLIHAGASGVGLSLIQLCKWSKRCQSIIVTVGSEDKGEYCKKQGATHYINYKQYPNWNERIVELLGSDSIDMILDPISGNYLEQDIKVLRLDGIIIGIASMGGTNCNIDTNLLLRKRITIQYSTLRSRSWEYKKELISEFVTHIGDAFEKNELYVNIDKVFPLQEIQQAHEYMEKNLNIGKIVVKVITD
ncbi:hypothetical protein ABK040_008849 [Willaertia magna]